MARLASDSQGGFYATPVDELQHLCKRIRLRNMCDVRIVEIIFKISEKDYHI